MLQNRLLKNELGCADRPGDPDRVVIRRVDGL
jgi:hypothetical protein